MHETVVSGKTYGDANEKGNYLLPKDEADTNTSSPRRPSHKNRVDAGEAYGIDGGGYSEAGDE
jgi:hypothetical protein